MAPPKLLRTRIASTLRWLHVLADGLDGRPHQLGETEGKAMERALERLGIYLFSTTKAKRSGLELRRGAAPVVRRYFGAPIQKHVELYAREHFK